MKPHSLLFCLILVHVANAFVILKEKRYNRIPFEINLFDGAGLSTNVLEQAQTIYSRGIPNKAIHDLKEGKSLPYDFQYMDSTIRVKQLQKEEVTEAVGLCLKEYGSYPSSTPESKYPLSKALYSAMDDFDNFLFTFIVLLGLGQRVERREKGDIDSSIPQDHNVVCLYEVGEHENENMIGMAEVSLQPADPSRTSPPFVLPAKVKNAFCSFGLWSKPMPYISNVLVTNEYRGKGYSKILMACCEGLAKSWGFEQVYLHVDADSRSGAPAQGLYRSLGYMPVIDNKYNKNFAWMGIDMVNRGLYIVDGVALLFLKKVLE
jgi:ribosomal protein S18 acetylase RimI-like enzyme